MWQDKVTGIIGLSKLPDVRIKELRQVAEKAITDSLEFEKREAAKEVHRAILRRGAEDWNKWREDNPETRPMLYDEDLSQDTFNADLRRANFANANLINAKFIGTDLEGANFHEANLKGAHLNDAKLTRANFCRADLYETDFSGATLVKANLQGTQMAKTIFKGATITECKVYGMSAWDVDLVDATQSDLIVRYRHKGKEDNDEDEITVYDLRLAQFVYLLLNNENIRNAIDSITWKTVLILGRFAPERISVLQALREALRVHKAGLVPILFDFEKPQSRDRTETISLLASMSRFIVADLTDARSVAFELERIVPHFQSIPVQPIILKTQFEPTLFDDLRRGRDWVLESLQYDDRDDLLQLIDKVIDNAFEKAEELANNAR